MYTQFSLKMLSLFYCYFVRFVTMFLRDLRILKKQETHKQTDVHEVFGEEMGLRMI